MNHAILILLACAVVMFGLAVAQFIQFTRIEPVEVTKQKVEPHGAATAILQRTGWDR